MKTQDDASRKHLGMSMAPSCVRCDGPMSLKTIAPMFAHPIDDIVYACPSCSNETRQAVRRAS